MKTFTIIFIVIITCLISCRQDDKSNEKMDKSLTTKIIFLHHSTGQNIWDGGSKNSNLFSRTVHKIGRELGMSTTKISYVQKLFKKYSIKFHKDYHIEDLCFPKESPYGWHNYPFDYYNIWIKHAGEIPYLEEPTLEILTGEYSLIIFKHCFPVYNIQADKDTSDINSNYKSQGNYKLQYLALRDKLHQFPDTKFVIWTGAAQVKSQVTEEEALRAREFFGWVVRDWDLPGDNIYVWDFNQLQTEGGLYFLDKYARNSHPNNNFSKYAAELFFSRLIDVIENDGLKTDNTGKAIN